MIQALSGDQRFLELLKQERMTGYVHSLFKRTINIMCLTNHQLYTLASRDIDNAPNTILLDCSAMENREIQLEDEVFCEGTVLQIGNAFRIDVSNVEVVEMTMPEFPENEERLKRNVASMKKKIEEIGTSGGIQEDTASLNLFDREVSKLLTARTEVLRKHVSKGRVHEAVLSANSIIGLGPGLTPSGDDYLTGLMAVFMVPNHPNPEWKLFCEEVASNALSATNIISYSAIFQASTGRIRVSLTQLLTCLFTGEEEDLVPALEAVLVIGSSSGTDMALGIIAGVELTMKIGGHL